MKKQTLVVDLESMANVPQYQKDIFNKLSAGIAAGTMNVISVGRQTGKSMLNMQLFKNRYYATNLCKEIVSPWHIQPKSKYKFSRNNWHWTEINSMADDYYERLSWCEEMFGAQPKNPDAWTRWYSSWSTLKFRDEADYMLYQLRWA